MELLVSSGGLLPTFKFNTDYYLMFILLLINYFPKLLSLSEGERPVQVVQDLQDTVVRCSLTQPCFKRLVHLSQLPP